MEKIPHQLIPRLAKSLAVSISAPVRRQPLTADIKADINRNLENLPLVNFWPLFLMC